MPPLFEFAVIVHRAVEISLCGIKLYKFEGKASRLLHVPHTNFCEQFVS